MIIAVTFALEYKVIVTKTSHLYNKNRDILRFGNFRKNI